MPAVPTAPLSAARVRGAAASAPPDAPWPRRALPGPLVWRMVLVAVLVLAVGGGLAGWWLVRAAGQAAQQQLVAQQNDEVEVLARLLSGKIEQSQTLLRTVADSITPAMLDATATLEWQLQQAQAAAQFFDTLLVVGSDGTVRTQQHKGRFVRLGTPDLQMRAVLESTLVEGKPQVMEAFSGGVDEARIVLTMPLHRDDGALQGVVAGGLRLQSPGLLPPALALPQRPGTRLLVFAHDGTILAHTNPVRVMGRVQDEPGLAEALEQGPGAAGGGASRVLPQAVVSMAGMPLAQWTVARVSDTQGGLAPAQGALRNAWLQAGVVLAVLAALLVLVLLWLAQPLARLRQQALQVLEPGGADAGVAWADWPQGGETGAVARAFARLQGQQAQQQRQLQGLQAQWAVLLEHSPQALAVTRGRTIEAAGHRASQWLGYAAHELQGQPVALLCADPLRGGQGADGISAPLGDGPAPTEETLRLRRKDGSVVHVQARGWPVRMGEPAAGMLWLLQERTTARQERRDSAWTQWHDTLTGLDNRQRLEQRLKACMLAGPAADAGVAAPVAVLLFLDLDYFTVINDTAGHGFGDEVLCGAARLLQEQVGSSGWVARLGGDEFAVLLPDCSEAYASSVAQGLCRTVQAWEPATKGRGFTLGVSIGMVVLDAACTDALQVLHTADMACYDAKRAGRNCVRRRAVPRQPAPVLGA